MKKVISVVLAALMLFSVMAVSVSAVGECKCGPAHVGGRDCLCCIYCPELPEGHIVSCAKKNADGEYTFCCTDCQGFIGANGKCGCSAECTCCVLNDDGTIGGSGDIGAIGGAYDEIWGEEQQNSFIETFQAILKKISDAFDRFFDAIFEFLRIEDVTGNGK
jgi:hypothetical protein